MVAHAGNLSIWGVKVIATGVQSHPWLHSEFEVSLGLKNKKIYKSKKLLITHIEDHL